MHHTRVSDGLKMCPHVIAMMSAGVTSALRFAMISYHVMMVLGFCHNYFFIPYHSESGVLP